MTKVIDANVQINFTTANGENLSTEKSMQKDVLDMFSSALDKYLHDRSIESNEMHIIFCDDLSIEDEEEF